MNFKTTFLICLCILAIGCGQSAEDSIVIPDVTQPYEAVLYPDTSTFEVGNTHHATISMSGNLDGGFIILYSERDADPVNPHNSPVVLN
jgi:hypothetical protein